ncbi:SH3 domain-containing protein [Octadecabacter sp.]|nr:SH3 domain-containing protein [Octadecabacter sp.]
MKTYVWLTFAFMGWGYYEMSGGDEFVPVQEPVLAAAEIEPVENLVTRASTPTLLSVSSSNVSTSQPAEAAIIPAAAQAVQLEDTEVETIVEVAAPIEAAPLDIRQVAGSRVNMRMGPSTDFDVITTLNSGAEMEVLEVNADGWARVSTVDRGIEGWMAERLLTAPQG